MMRTVNIILGSIAITSIATIAVSQGQLPKPGTTPVITPVLIEPPEPGTPMEWTNAWYHSFCLPIASCRALASNPCVPDGGCDANTDDFGFPLVSTWCEASLLMSECSGGWSAFAKCKQTRSAIPTCGPQWNATCACNGTLQNIAPTGMECARPMCQQK